MTRSRLSLKNLARDALSQFLAANLTLLSEDEALEILANPHLTPRMAQVIANNVRLTAFHSVRVKLVALRQTPQAHAVKLVHYLYWPDLVRLSVDVTVPAAVRRAIDTQLLNRVGKLTLGEKISSARRCSQALIKALLYDPDPKIFAALLVNQKLREEDLVDLANSEQVTVEQLTMLAEDRRWSSRYAIRKAIVVNPRTPRSTAARQLRFLSRRDLRLIHDHPATSIYLRRCIERMTGNVISE